MAVFQIKLLKVIDDDCDSGGCYSYIDNDTS